MSLNAILPEKNLKTFIGLAKPWEVSEGKQRWVQVRVAAPQWMWDITATPEGRAQAHHTSAVFRMILTEWSLCHMGQVASEAQCTCTNIAHSHPACSSDEGPLSLRASGFRGMVQLHEHKACAWTLHRPRQRPLGTSKRQAENDVPDGVTRSLSGY